MFSRSLRVFQVLGLLSILLAPTAQADTFYFWRYRTHATDCTALTDGKVRDLCFEVDNQTLYKCEPTAGDCSGSEWKLTGGGTETNSLETITTGIQTTEIPIGTAADTVVFAPLSGDVTMTNGGVVTIGTDAVALGTDTTGNYAGSSSEGGAATTATALDADPTDCSAGSYAIGINASGTAQGCTDATTEIDSAIATAASNYEPAGVAVADITDATANGRALISSTNYASMRGLLDLESGTDFLAYSAFSANGISLVGAANYAAMRTLLDLEAGTDFYSISAADTLLAAKAPLVSPSFTTPTLGVASATSINKVAITAPATGSTLTIADGKTLTATNTVNLNTMTDGKWCKFTASGTLLNCDQDAPGGSITGTDTHVTFFDGANSPAGDAGFTYNKTTDSATLAGDLTVATEAYDATGWNGDNTVPTKDAVRDKIETLGAGSDTNAVKEFLYPAVALLPVEPADGITPITKTANTNIDTLTTSYNDSADECRTAVIQVPSDVQSGSTVTFRWKWFSLTATSGSVVWDVRYQSTGAEGESADGTTTIKAAASDAVQGTVKQYTTTTVTETLANLGWAASDTISLLVCRDGNGTAGTDDMTGDAELYTFAAEMPRA